MTVGEIKKLLTDLPDDTPLLADGKFGYLEAYIYKTTALYSKESGWVPVGTEADSLEEKPILYVS